jgi:hypothetical protein
MPDRNFGSHAGGGRGRLILLESTQKVSRPMAVESPVTSDAAILSRVLQPRNGALSKAAARSWLALDFTDEDRARMHVLAQKAQDGALDAREQADLESYRRVGRLLEMMRSKARRSLQTNRAGANGARVAARASVAASARTLRVLSFARAVLQHSFRTRSHHRPQASWNHDPRQFGASMLLLQHVQGPKSFRHRFGDPENRSTLSSTPPQVVSAFCLEGCRARYQSPGCHRRADRAD